MKIAFVLFLLFAAILFFDIVIKSIQNSITPMPSSSAHRAALISYIEKVNPLHIVDLGSGWGGLLFHVAKKFPHTQCVGIENCLLPFLFAWIKSKIYRFPNVTFYYTSFFKVDLSSFDMCILYQSYSGMERITKKLETLHNVNVVSIDFAIRGKRPINKIACKGIFAPIVYCYYFV